MLTRIQTDGGITALAPEDNWYWSCEGCFGEKEKCEWIEGKSTCRRVSLFNGSFSFTNAPNLRQAMQGEENQLRTGEDVPKGACLRTMPREET
jgi:hypothetical protein